MSSSDATMSSPIFVPDALKFYVNRLSFSKNRVRLQTLSSVRAGPSSQIIVRLPSNTMVNLASLTMTGSVRATVTSAATNEAVALPTNFDFSFIETLSLIANGGIITQPFTNYKLLGNMLNDIYGSQDKILSRSGLQGSLPSPLIDADIDSPPLASQYVPFAINNWISATQTMAPSYISTNLLGDLELRLTMADTSILATGDKRSGEEIDGLQARATWDMKDLNFYIETASVQSNMLEQAIAAKLAAGEPINVPFENVFSFSQTNTSGSFNQRFSVSSQSVNKILATVQRDSDFKPDQRKLVNGIPSAFLRHSNGAQVAQFSVNNQYSPNYQIDSELNDAYDPITPATIGNRRDMRISNALVETRAAMDIPDYDYDQADMLCQPTQMPFQFLGGGVYADGSQNYWVQPPSAQIVNTTTTSGLTNFPGSKNTSTYWFPYVDQQPIRHFLDNKFMLATSFDLDVCDKDRLVSGINTLGSNAQMFLNVVGDGGSNSQSTVYVLCTSMVQIYQGATLKIIQ